MKYLVKYTESIVEWETGDYKALSNELHSKIKGVPNISFLELKEVCDKYNVEIVDQKEFLSDLDSDKKRKEANSILINPIFGLTNPKTNNIRMVIGKKQNYNL